MLELWSKMRKWVNLADGAKLSANAKNVSANAKNVSANAKSSPAALLLLQVMMIFPNFGVPFNLKDLKRGKQQQIASYY